MQVNGTHFTETQAERAILAVQRYAEIYSSNEPTGSLVMRAAAEKNGEEIVALVQELEESRAKAYAEPAVALQGPDAKYEIDYYTISGDLPDTESNYDVEEWVKGNLPSDLRPHVTFDSESGCFFAYAKTQQHAEAFTEFMNSRPWKGLV